MKNYFKDFGKFYQGNILKHQFKYILYLVGGFILLVLMIFWMNK
jgi:hypothetical protein